MDKKVYLPYVKGHYYKHLGIYLGIRKTRYVGKDKKSTYDHIFSTGKRDSGGAIILNRVEVDNT